MGPGGPGPPGWGPPPPGPFGGFCNIIGAWYVFIFFT